MTEFFEILKYTVPSLVVLLITYFVLKKFTNFHNESLSLLKKSIEKNSFKDTLKAQSEEKETILPLKLQAYERLVLFLERINPSNLIVREIEPGMSASQFRKKLLNVVREEYEHNITQQIYVSEKVWNMVKNAKESVLSLINDAFAKVNPDDPAVNLGERILAGIIEEDKDPVTQAVSAVKNEMNITFKLTDAHG